jgi:alpha-tubulin suppressor-like RCC1 family protein
MRSVRRLLILSVLTASTVVACSSDSTTDPFAPPGLALSLSPTVDTVFVNDSIAAANAGVLTLSATSLGSAVQTPAGVEWTSSDPTVAVVGPGGKVTPVGLGTTTVTARVNSAHATATVVVASVVSKLTVTPTSLVGLVGDTVQLTASAIDAKGVLAGGVAYAFSSADPSVATVTSTGARTARVTFAKAGSAAVSVSAGAKTATATGTIQPREFISAAVAGAPAGALVLSAGQDATCGILPLGRAYCFGRQGLLGIAKDTTCFNDVGASESCTLIPLRVAGQLNIVSVSVGDSVACGATADNRAYCWGSQTYGQLGNGVASSGTSTTPALVIGAASRTAVSLARVAAGGNHACGLSPSGAAFCWGKDDLFQLGNGDGLSLNSTTPIPVAGGTVFNSITAGQNHTCALTAGGSAFCWGDNSSGQLGAGTFASTSDVPLGVAGTFVAISAGGTHTCALTAAGVAQCWGDNSSGQLGVSSSTTFQSNTPVTVDGGLHFKSISAGRFNTCGITTGGAAFCWGDNSSWQLGTTSLFFSDAPVAVSGGHTDFTSITTGVRHACALSAAGAFCWGSNVLGALGNEFQAILQATPQKTAVPQ